MTAARTFEYEERTVYPPYKGSDSSYAYYSASNNSFTVNHRPGDQEFNKQSHDVYTACHEMKHRDNLQAGMYAYALNPEQAYKVNMHDEISANIAQLIAVRDEYLKTGNIDVLDNEPRFKFYKDAILNGEINPHSTKKEDFDREMRLIANGTKDMWIKKYSHSNTYTKQNAVSGAYNCERNNKHSEYYNSNYERAKKIAYGNIGGVDFTKYMQGDVEIPPKGRELLNDNLKKITKDGRKAFYEANADIIMAEYFEREDDNLLVKAAGRKVKNEPINPINKRPPKYPPNAKIEQRQIPDMRTNIIQKPLAYILQQERNAINVQKINNIFGHKPPRTNSQNGHPHSSAETGRPNKPNKPSHGSTGTNRPDKPSKLINIIRNRKRNSGNSF